MTNEIDGSLNSNNKSNNIENSWVFLSKDGFIGESQSSIISLKHPRYDKKTKYLFSDNLKKIYEIQTFNSQCRSWLIDNTIRKDGNVYVCTPIDPLFLVLPYFKEQCTEKAIPLEHLLESETDSELNVLSSLIFNLDNLGDMKGPASLKAYKYNEDKTFKWLKSKIEKVVEVLKRKKIHVRPGAISTTFVISDTGEEAIDEGDYLKYALGVVGEYLNDETFRMLCSRLNIDLDVNCSKRKNDEDNLSGAKRMKTDSKGLNENSKGVTSQFFNNNSKMKEEKIKQVTISSKEKQRQKAANGTKNIMTFFSKK